MKKLLIISETWYPDSRATISIMTRIAEGIAQKGIEVYVVPLKPLANGEQYPSEHNGVKILTLNTDCSKTVGQKLRMLLQKAIQKLLYAEKRLLIKDRECKWNSWITWLRSYQREHWYAPICDSIQAEDNAFRIAAAVEEKRIVSLLSVGAPFWIHDTAARVCSNIRKQKLTWVPINFDPYAYIEFISSEERRRRIRQEKKTFKNAHRILMLSQSKEDYRRNPMLPKMDFFEIPNIRRLSSDYPNEHVKFDEKCIDCVCIGNLYWIVRRPDSLFSMFEKFSDSRIRLHVVGALIQGFPEGYIEYWKQRLGDRFFYHGRVCQEEAVSIMKSADILVNIGNTTSNQCPSKVLEYISTGKPIVSISKIEHCTSKVYLDRYPLACQINESDSERQGQIDQVEAFVREKYRQQIPFGEIASIFSDCTNEKAVETVLDAFK